MRRVVGYYDYEQRRELNNILFIKGHGGKKLFIIKN